MPDEIETGARRAGLLLLVVFLITLGATIYHARR